MLFLFSCLGKRAARLNAEIFCPEIGQKILIGNVTSAQFWEALNNFHSERMKRGSGEDYTVLIFSNHHSTQIKGAKSEQMLRCYARDITWDQASPDYIVY